MNKPLAIKKYCFECAGGTNKEVTLCVVFECPLWEWRFGYPARSKRYRERTNTAISNYHEELAEMHYGGIDIRPFFATDASWRAFLKTNGINMNQSADKKSSSKSTSIVNPT